MNTNLVEQIVEAILDADRLLANQLIDDWAAEKGYDRALIKVISCVLNEIGIMNAPALFDELWNASMKKGGKK